MLICGECGARNDDGESFCGACEAYLGWQQPAATEGKASPPDPQTVARPEPSPETAVLPQIPVPQKTKPAHSPRRQTATGKRAADGGTPVNEGAEQAGKTGARAEHRTVPVSLAGTNPLGFPDGEPIPVKPGERVTRAPQPDRERGRPHSEDGSLICATCGTGNQPDRSFCRRCAASFTTDASVQTRSRLPWWKQVLGSPEQMVLPAGSRPKSKSRRFPTKSAASVAVLGLLGGAASANSDSIGRPPQRIMDEIFQKEVLPTATTASTPNGRGADFATDTDINTSWVTDLKAGERANYWEARFKESIDLVYVFITGGPTGQPPSTQVQRPSEVVISVRREGDKDGSFRDIAEVTPADDGKRHGFYMGVDNVTAVRLTITAPRNTEVKSVSIAGVQFTKR